jgi:hypothetical protein
MAHFQGREAYRKAQELEEARKAGLAPAAVDEDGKEINPHIPQYMAAAPWYLNNDKPVRRVARCVCRSARCVGNPDAPLACAVVEASAELESRGW